ncbi:hypothetical protein ACN47E_004049 [Coniothyrium glycines]
MYLDKRDNMGFAMAPSLIIFLVILGAGAMVICGFAVMRFFGGDLEDQSHWNQRTPEQDAYMREVRERNWSKLPQLGIQQMQSSATQNMAHAPISQSGNSTTTYG